MTGWISELQKDLCWLSFSPHYYEYFKYDINQWAAVVSVDPALFIRNVKRYATSDGANMLCHAMREYNVTHKTHNIENIYECDICGHIEIRTRT